METKVATVIVTFNNSEGLDKLLTSLQLQEFQVNEIIVIDNASSDNTNALIKGKYPGLTYFLMNENLGSAGGYYEGIKYASSKNDLIWILDDDMSVFPNTLLKLVETFKKLEPKGKLGAVRCTVKPDAREFFESDDFAWRGTLISSSITKEIGYPNKDYYLYAEDLEYSTRIKKAGYKIYYSSLSKMIFSRPNQAVYTVAGLKVSFYDEPFRLYYSIRNLTYFYSKNLLIIDFFHLVGYSLKILLCLLKYPIKKKGKFFSAVLYGFLNGITSKLGKSRRFIPASNI